MADVIREHIEIVHGASGPKPRISGHRIRVQDVVIWHEKLGLSADEILRTPANPKSGCRRILRSRECGRSTRKKIGRKQ